MDTVVPVFGDIATLLYRVLVEAPTKYAHAKPCSFCSSLFCLDCNQNNFCSHDGCGKVACPEDKILMFWCASCQKTFCKACRSSSSRCTGQDCTNGNPCLCTMCSLTGLCCNCSG